MFTVTDAAVQAVAEYFKETDVKPIRVFLNQGCGGRQLAMALDQTKPSDHVHEAGGFQFIMDSALLEEAGPVTIDFSNLGFRIDSNIKPGEGCQSCGSAGSCCGS